MSETESSSLISFFNSSGKRNLSSIHWFLSNFSIFSKFSFFNWLRSSCIDIHCFFSSVTNINSCSGCSCPLPPPQPAGAGPPPGALVAPANCFRGAVLRYCGGVTSIVLKCFPQLSQSQWLLPHFGSMLFSYRSWFNWLHMFLYQGCQF